MRPYNSLVANTLLFALALGSWACDPVTEKHGASGEACYANGACNPGLDCAQGECIAIAEPEPEPEPEPIPPPGATTTQVLEPVRDLDILFVVDNSGSMREEQAALLAAFPGFMSLLTDSLGLPNLHIAVVSTDMGAGPYGIMGCTGDGDNGRMNNFPAGVCDAPSDTFIVDVLGEDGSSRTKNYPGELSDVFSCIAELGTSGCGFEQTFESMRRALDGTNPDNAGFLREDAALAVIVISDEDDCSASDVSMYDSDPALDRIDSPIGPLSSFRCFEFGVHCDPDDPRTPGARQNCVVREDSPFMPGVSEYADFLQGLKSSSGKVFFSAVAGVGDVVIGERDGEPNLEAGCTSASGDADPAIRIAALANMLGAPEAKSICQPLATPLAALGRDLKSMMGGQCLLAAADAATCTFADVAHVGTANELLVQALPPCESSASGACASVVSDPDACTYGSGLRVAIQRRGSSVPDNTQVVAICAE
jgi:hypothetical protein